MILTESQLEWQEKAREFAEKEIRPISLERDRIADPAETFDWDIIEKGSRLGFRTAVVSKEFGGGEIDTVTQVLVMKELARGDSAIGKTFSQCWKWSQMIEKACSPAQRERFLPEFVSNHRFLLGKAGTEEAAGSDNRMYPNEPSLGFRMSAVRDGDEWVLNGRKRYIANGGVASLYFVLTRTDLTVGTKKGSTLFLVPKDTPGFRIGQRYDKIGWRFYQNAELIFEDARVPDANRVGEVNGATEAMGGYAQSEFGEWELGANALGICEAAVEMGVAHCKTRIQGGVPIIEHQAIRLKLHEMLMLTEALRAFVMSTAQAVDEKVPVAGRNKRLLQNYASDVVQRVTYLNMEVHGGAGVMRDVGAEKLFRDAAIWTHLASDTVQRLKAVASL